MRPDISATEVVRNFSELLNNIKYRGQSYRIIRGGKPAAALVPVDEADHPRVLADLNEIFQSLPRLDHDDLDFADDILGAVNAQPSQPDGPSWE